MHQVAKDVFLPTSLAVISFPRRKGVCPECQAAELEGRKLRCLAQVAETNRSNANKSEQPGEEECGPIYFAGCGPSTGLETISTREYMRLVTWLLENGRSDWTGNAAMTKPFESYCTW